MSVRSSRTFSASVAAAAVLAATVVGVLSVGPVHGWQPLSQPQQHGARTVTYSRMNTVPAARPRRTALNMFTKEKKDTVESSDRAEETTEKFGLEAGLMQAAKEKDGESAKSLLKKYGIAYLATSIPLALVSFSVCYVLVDNGVDVASLLSNVGIESSSMADKAGTFAIAYAAHKALSPVRFPPTVLLTPVVARLIGKEPEAVTED